MTTPNPTSEQAPRTRPPRLWRYGASRRRQEALRAARQDESGFTLVELALSMVIMAVVLALFVPTLLVLMHGESSVGALSDVNVKVQPALELLQNQVNSATRLFDPVGTASSYYCTGTTARTPRGCRTTVKPGFALLMDTVAANSDNECSQWRVHTTPRVTTPTTPSRHPPQLQYRTWSPTSPPLAVPFQDAAEGVSIANTTNTRTIQEPFRLAGSSSPKNLEVVVTLWLSPSQRASKLQLRTVDALQGVSTAPATACTVPPGQ